jgi:transposase
MMLGMVRQGVISDEFWELVEPVLPAVSGRVGRPWADHRRMLEGICWRYRTGSPWRDLPAEFGPWQTVWKRHFRWSAEGTYLRMLGAVQGGMFEPEAEADLEAQLEALLSVDATVVRAHQHAAGARADSVTDPGAVEPAELRGGRIELHEFAGRAS